MKRRISAAGLFIRSFPTVILFELIFKLILVALGAPLFSLLLGAAMRSAKISYLTSDNVARLLKNPLTWIMFLLMLLLLAVFSITELSGLAGCYAAKSSRRKMNVSGMFITGFRAFAKAIRGTGIFRLIGFAFVVPMAQFSLASGIFFAPFMPLIRQAADSSGHKLLFAALLILIEGALIFFLALRSYSLHFLVLTEYSYSESLKKSCEMLRGKRLKMAVGLLLWSLMLTALAAAVTFAAGFFVMLFIKGFSRPEAALNSALRVLSYAWEIFTIISVMISSPMIMCFITAKFLRDTENSEKITVPDSVENRIHPAVRFTAAAVLTALAFFLNFSYLQQLYKGNVDFGLLTKPQITAHRGFSAKAPENSEYAFLAAIDAGADYIELDVQQSSDGEIVVFHDSKLDRTTNGTGNVSDYTYTELSSFSCGEWFGEGEYSDAKIMLLSDVLALCGDDIMLNIEIKKTGNAKDTAAKVVALLEEYEMTDSCYITSFSYQALKTVKETDPSVKTGLILTIASAAVYSNMQYIDAISVNYIFADQNMISTAHRNGKKVFVWTVNNSSDITRMTTLGADNIITDHPDTALKTVYSYGVGDFVMSLLESIFGSY